MPDVVTAITGEEFAAELDEALRLLGELRKLAPKASALAVGLLGVALIDEAVRRCDSGREWWADMVRLGKLPPGTVVMVKSDDERKG